MYEYEISASITEVLTSLDLAEIKPSVRGNACEVFSGWYGRRLQHVYKPYHLSTPIVQ